ncbi:pantoate--beta-alanine ligase [Microbacterium sp. SORGH_AS 1204]|uniref:pantoate--beta-alanine ligase n=1 Tax=Microbacterium sp. SORGH_AS_1204 TaxID=3041785 RepID=UPI002792785A|nr:pantoate--beta-alanine ligase [Microbacterium sp. SORGH_AS_1204]MDQ1138081.1 pantoate--beta-alanine ligase [Microbacterium sp. SORGH_AS_1204]
MIRTIEDLRTRLGEIRGADHSSGGPRVALVSTLGALHDGHVDLVHEAREHADIVVVSTFVNPLRFRTADETAAYPRSPEADERVLDDLGVDVVFAPAAGEFLPAGTATTRVSAGDVGLRYEGRVRPFYFDGVLTVEAKLFNLMRPDVAVYGERDLQRVFLVERMVRDLDFAVDIRTVPTVRTDDGLPVSSRIGLLEPADRRAAAKLPRALEAAASNSDLGVDACIAAAQSALMGEPRIALEYLSVVDPATFLPVDDGHRGRALALIAATVGGHRFIDNAEISLR